ncbi:hypothetical protein CC79DRAFT_1363793 [Sarocladium strictum]
MAETSNQNWKRKAEDSLADEAPSAKFQVCSCHDEARKGRNLIALKMDNYDLVQLGIDGDRNGNFSISPQVLSGILDTIRARPEYWHLEWRRVETEIDEILDRNFITDPYIDAKEIHSLLNTAQETTERDRNLIREICAATLDKPHSVAWGLIKPQKARIGTVLQHLLGLSTGQIDTEPDQQALVRAFISMAKLKGFEVDREASEDVDLRLQDDLIEIMSSTFQALRTQMLRVVLYYEVHYEYARSMAEIVSALAEGSHSEEHTAPAGQW